MQISDLVLEANPWWKDPADRKAVHPVRRHKHKELLSRIQDLNERRATLLFGPRRVGKSVLVAQVADDLIQAGWPPRNVLFYDFSDERTPRGVTPEEVAAVEIPGLDPKWPKVLLLDEIARVREWEVRWDLWLKRMVDKDRAQTSPRVRILATDSSANLLHRGSLESGQGRWDEIRLRGVSFLEYLEIRSGGVPGPSDAFTSMPDSLERFLLTGGFPEYVLSDNLNLARNRIRSETISLAIDRDLAEQVREIRKLEQLFVHLVEMSGAVFDPVNRSVDLNVDPRSIDQWVRLLEHAALIERLEPLLSVPAKQTPKARTRLRSRSKIYAADHALVSAFVAGADPLSDHSMAGRVYETLVHGQLRQLAGAEDSLNYWRVDDLKEIDFVLATRKGRVAMEVTKSLDPNAEKRASLGRHADRIAARRSVLVHGGLELDEKHEPWLVPIHRFLLEPSRYALP